MNTVFLTFDVEDFINQRSINCLLSILKMLQRYNLKAIFFITGYMAYRISNNKTIFKLLQNHEIGYHSSSHSVRPIIPEFTDINNYKLAIRTSLERETSYIHPFTGEIQGEGGIKKLKEIFNDKEVNSFRAPGLCWSPPHLEALIKLGIKYDFSTRNLIIKKPLFYKGITFYPTTFQIDILKLINIPKLIFLILQRNITTLFAHPNSYVNTEPWDSIYFKGNPKKIVNVMPSTRFYTMYNVCKLESILNILFTLKKKGKIEITPKLKKSEKILIFERINIKELYESSIIWCKYFNYKPKYLFSHFKKYFQANEIFRDLK